MPATAPHPATRPWTARLVSLLVGLEAVALAVVGVRFLASLFTPHVLPVGGIVFAAVVLFGGAVWLGAAARGTWRGLRWPRAAVLVTQAFLIVVGFSAARGGFPVAGIPAVAVAVVTLLALFARPTVAWMARSSRYPAP